MDSGRGCGCPGLGHQVVAASAAAGDSGGLDSAALRDNLSGVDHADGHRAGARFGERSFKIAVIGNAKLEKFQRRCNPRAKPQRLKPVCSTPCKKTSMQESIKVFPMTAMSRDHGDDGDPQGPS